MFEKMSHLVLSGKEYPYKCDILVLEKIQEEYKDLSEFENKLSGFIPAREEDGSIKRNEDGYMLGTYGTPDIKTVNKALCWMIQEGLEIEAEGKKKSPAPVTEKEILRKVDISPNELGRLLQKEFGRCFERKNEETT